MATLPLPSVLVALGANAPAVEPDGELLARFVSSADDAAFTLLVRRYARLVWRVARTRCRTESTAEEVFQATFVVFARKAGSIRTAAALPGWLHRTAYRLAVKAAGRDRSSPPLPTDIPVSADPLDALSARELLAAVDDEMAKLSDAERSVLVLCGVENQSLDEAAVRLGCTVGAVKGRLERSRVKLRNRLDARGLTLPAVVLTLFSGPPARAVEAAVSLSGGDVPPAVEQLLSGGTHMTRRFVALGLVAVLVAGGVGTGLGFLPHRGPAATAAPVPKALKPRPAEAWGEVIDGLQAGLRMPGGAVIESGQTAELRVVVRNVSEKPILVTYTQQMPGVSVSGGNNDGEVELSWFAHINGLLPEPQVVTLAPGQELVRWTVPIDHPPPGVKITTPEFSTVLHHGTYWFVMKPIGGDLLNVAKLGIQPAFDRLGTGTLEVVLPEPQPIKAPVPKEKGSPVVWSEPVKTDWQASRAERLVGIWTPDGKSVLVPSPTVVAQDEKLDFGGVDVRNAETGKVTKRLAFKPNGKVDQMFLPQSLAVSPEGKTVYAAGSLFAPGGKGEAARGVVTWKDVSKDDPPEVVASADPPESPLALSPDGKQLATTAGDIVVVSDAAGGKWLWTSKVGGKRGKPTALAFNATDSTMAVGTGAGDWVAIDAKTGRVLHTIADLGMGVSCLATSADGKSLAFGGLATTGGQSLVVFAAKEVHKIADAVPEKVTIHGLAFPPDGKHLFAACSDGELRVFETESGKKVVAVKEHKGDVFTVAFSPDGKQLLTVGRDAVKVWDVATLLKSK